MIGTKMARVRWMIGTKMAPHQVVFYLHNKCLEPLQKVANGACECLRRLCAREEDDTSPPSAARGVVVVVVVVVALLLLLRRVRGCGGGGQAQANPTA